MGKEYLYLNISLKNPILPQTLFSHKNMVYFPDKPYSPTNPILRQEHPFYAFTKIQNCLEQNGAQIILLL